MNEDTLIWDAKEYHHWDKSSDWYWSLGIIAVSIAILCILFKNLLFALFVLLAAFTAGMYAHREPNVARVEAGRRGIRVHNHFYTWDSLESFWIEERDHHPKILIKSHRFFSPYIVVPLGEVHPEEIRSYFLPHIPEVEHHESIIHKALEYLGF